MTRHARADLERRPDAGDVELADAIEAVWLARWGRVPVVAAVVLAKLRRGTP